VKNNKLIHWFIITTFVSLYLIVSIISTIHVIDFFKLSNPSWLAISLAVAFEIGAAASLASLIVLDKMNKSLVWSLFIVLTGMQMMGNTYYAFSHIHEYDTWVQLFGLVDEDPIYQKRILSIISGAILPLVALGFIKSLVDYIKPQKEISIAEDKQPTVVEPTDIKESFVSQVNSPVNQVLAFLKKENKNSNNISLEEKSPEIDNITEEEKKS